MDFKFEKDGWAHIMPFGEFPHAETGVIQVLDTEALEAIEDNFTAKSKAQNFPGLLVDFDHFSMDTDKPSEAEMKRLQSLLFKRLSEGNG